MGVTVGEDGASGVGVLVAMGVGETVPVVVGARQDAVPSKMAPIMIKIVLYFMRDPLFVSAVR